ncbi:unnamed protein product [Spirodela intermedia]|uniref:DUF7851 domain-containing protein n=2 Tax=Spirodela intermedia TaxID=51605 RepID=A0A7I8JGW2_SPIIN|nr:unnamed protein product [Spirodela intermedia]CAA6669380.1 unnamed protein product [Spirodela intermedia]CAA7406330.1 unnamed protein product [Spirodela intermedia]
MEGENKRRGEETAESDAHFKVSSDVKGIRFGGQLVVKSFTVRRAVPVELLCLLSLPLSSPLPFPSATAYLPTSFTILARRAWQTLTLGMDDSKPKALLFVFESEDMKAAADRVWPPVIPLGEVDGKLLRGLVGCEMARFKLRKGCLTFYVYAVRRAGAAGFRRASDLRALLESVAAAKDFTDFAAMLSPLQRQRSITFSSPSAMAH